MSANGDVRWQKLTAGYTAKTERNLASKAGHLEMLAGGKKDKKDQKKQIYIECICVQEGVVWIYDTQSENMI